MKRVCLAATAFLFGFPIWCQHEEPAKPAPKPQPIPFSHKLHVAFEPECSYCHEMPEPGEDMTYPAESKCAECHTGKPESAALQKLAAYEKDHEDVPWVQIYALPDYVVFSHKTHIQKGKIACETCHGPVAERDVITREKDISMKACVDCHTEKHARVACNTCHVPHP